MNYSDFSSDSKLGEVLTPGAPVIAQWVKSLPAMQETWLQEDPFGGRDGSPLQYSCLENPWTEEPGGL